MTLERVVTVGLRRPDVSHTKFNYLMEELRRLVETAGGQVQAQFEQTKQHPEPGTYLGEGKLYELAKEVQSIGVKTIVFNDDLTAAQQKKIEKIIPAKVVDRTRLILDIFAQRARTKEGQLQVELAQLNYLVPRLTGAWRGFSQQMGGIGTRGPGERKIEVERRYVRERIKRLKKEIDEVKAHRDRIKLNRQAVPLPQIALVGYTNVGKSTLLNTLVGEEAVYADDKLFATLDPTTRRVKLPQGRTVLFTDTVGFIQQLPHSLVAAFHATLEEVLHASLLLHVIDASAENQADQAKTVEAVIKELGADHLPTLTIVNKSDRLTASQKAMWERAGTLCVSAKTGEGIEKLLSLVETKLDEKLMEVSFDLPHDKRHLLGDLYRMAHILSERPAEHGTALRIRIDDANWKRLSHQLNLEGASRP